MVLGWPALLCLWLAYPDSSFLMAKPNRQWEASIPELTGVADQNTQLPVFAASHWKLLHKKDMMGFYFFRLLARVASLTTNQGLKVNCCLHLHHHSKQTVWVKRYTGVCYASVSTMADGFNHLAGREMQSYILKHEVRNLRPSHLCQWELVW